MEFLWLVIPVLIFLTLVVWKLRHKPTLTRNQLDKATRAINRTKKLDPNHGLMDAHKAFVSAVSTLYNDGHKVGAAKVLNRVAKRFPNQKAIWHLHRQRNLAAHQPNHEIYQSTFDQARREFVRALKSLR